MTFNWKVANPSSAAPTGTMIQNAVKNYRSHGSPLSNYMAIYNDLVSDTYGKNVNAGLNNGARLQWLRQDCFRRGDLAESGSDGHAPGI